MEGGSVTEGNGFIQPHLCTNYNSPRVFRPSHGWNGPISELLLTFGPVGANCCLNMALR